MVLLIVFLISTASMGIITLCGYRWSAPSLRLFIALLQNWQDGTAALVAMVCLYAVSLAFQAASLRMIALRCGIGPFMIPLSVSCLIFWWQMLQPLDNQYLEILPNRPDGDTC